VILAHVGLDAKGIATAIRTRFATRKPSAVAKPAA